MPDMPVLVADQVIVAGGSDAAVNVGPLPVLPATMLPSPSPCLAAVDAAAVIRGGVAGKRDVAHRQRAVQLQMPPPTSAAELPESVELLTVVRVP